MVYPKTPKSTTPTLQRRWLILLLAMGAGIVVVAGGLLWFFSGDAPAGVDLSETAAAVTSNSDETGGVPAGIEGKWAVDTTLGEFTVEDTTTATYVGFRVEEVLNSIGSNTAVGRTPDVSGTIAIEGTTLKSAEILADFTSVISDESRRDDQIRSALNTSTHPNATFVLTESIELGDGAGAGELVSTTATGELTINGVTNNATFELEAQLIDGVILVTGTSDIVFAAYNVEVPSSQTVLSVEDFGIVELQLWLSQ